MPLHLCPLLLLSAKYTPSLKGHLQPSLHSVSKSLQIASRHCVHTQFLNTVKWSGQFSQLKEKKFVSYTLYAWIDNVWINKQFYNSPGFLPVFCLRHFSSVKASEMTWINQGALAVKCPWRLLSRPPATHMLPFCSILLKLKTYPKKNYIKKIKLVLK